MPPSKLVASDRRMIEQIENLVRVFERPKLADATLLMAFSGWMDGGDVSTGTVQRTIDLLDAKPFAEIDPEPFYLYNFPGSMEITALFRPHIRIENGTVHSVEMPANTLYVHEPENLVMFVGKEPNLRWRTFAACLFHLARDVGISRFLFVGSFGGTVPHTRDPRLYVTCSREERIPSLKRYGLRTTDYEGPGSFMSYLMTQVEPAGLEMTSLIAEIPSYLQGTNPLSIEAVTRRLAKILKLPMDLDSLRQTSNDWEVEVTEALQDNEEMVEQIRQLEQDYDDDLLGADGEQ